MTKWKWDIPEMDDEAIEITEISVGDDSVCTRECLIMNITQFYVSTFKTCMKLAKNGIT